MGAATRAKPDPQPLPSHEIARNAVSCGRWVLAALLKLHFPVIDPLLSYFPSSSCEGVPNPLTFPVATIDIGLKGHTMHYLPCVSPLMLKYGVWLCQDGTVLKWSPDQIAEALQYG